MFSNGSAVRKYGAELYQVEPAFREQVDTCAEICALTWDWTCVASCTPTKPTPAAAVRLKQTASAQPALFVINIPGPTMDGLGRATSGHDRTQHREARSRLPGRCVSLEDALALVATRGRLMQPLLRGAMLAVPLSGLKYNPVWAEISLAAINSPTCAWFQVPTTP
jgi:acyl transferase domain-containing protein